MLLCKHRRKLAAKDIKTSGVLGLMGFGALGLFGSVLCIVSGLNPTVNPPLNPKQYKLKTLNPKP